MASVDSCRVFVEVGDFLRYFDGCPTPTGIGRVQAQLVPELLRAFPGRIRLCELSRRGDRLRLLDLAEFLARSDSELFLRRHGGRWSQPAFQLGRFLARRARTALMQSPGSSDRRFAEAAQPGDVVLSLGSSWDHPGYAQKMRRIKARYGLRLAVLVHDVLPVSHPQFCSAAFVPAFEAWLADMAAAWDIVMTPSDYSGARLADHLRANGFKQPQMRTIRFGGGFGASVSDDAARPLAERRIVLQVSTVEVRKNHLLMVRIWERFAARHGTDRLPDLVFAGKLGWDIEPLLARLKASDWLGGRIRAVSDLSDDALRALYGDARFTVFPSFCEGWGLPVAESLYFGRYCIASNATSIPEVGGDWVDYFAPDDFETAYRLVERALLDDAYVEARERHIRENYVCGTWRQTARAMGELLMGRQTEAAAPSSSRTLAVPAHP